MHSYKAAAVGPAKGKREKTLRRLVSLSMTSGMGRKLRTTISIKMATNR